MLKEIVLTAAIVFFACVIIICNETYKASKSLYYVRFAAISVMMIIILSLVLIFT